MFWNKVKKNSNKYTYLIVAHKKGQHETDESSWTISTHKSLKDAMFWAEHWVKLLKTNSLKFSDGIPVNWIEVVYLNCKKGTKKLMYGYYRV